MFPRVDRQDDRGEDRVELRRQFRISTVPNPLGVATVDDDTRSLQHSHVLDIRDCEEGIALEVHLPTRPSSPKTAKSLPETVLAALTNIWTAEDVIVAFRDGKNVGGCWKAWRDRIGGRGLIQIIAACLGQGAA